ncbi:hemicentin-1-like [Conger conger]|uniref:hemicentin-1-like n=1 Tax=Conger conger TaxID=82655 RepID=UPI002A5AA1D7|nr:hemicentin-1-like [Conger conger]
MESRNCGFLLMVELFLALMFGLNGTDPIECPLMIQPPRVVVRYGDPVSVKCTVSGDHEGSGWDPPDGVFDLEASGELPDTTDVQFVTWSLESLTNWEITARCYVKFLADADLQQCDKRFNITVYKPPDSVSISVVDHTGPMLEGKQYQLRCELQNTAPVQYLTVKWYKGETFENQTSYDDLTKTPVNVSTTLLITPTCADDGAQYSCVAELELGPEGPQPSPEVKSDPLSIPVHCETIDKPRFTECPDHEQLREGETLDTLVSCRAEGNPSPMVTWYRNQSEFSSSTPLTRRDGGQYTLIAKNSYGTANHTLEIEVLYKPRITQYGKLREGETLATLVSCRAEGNPSPMVTWYRDQSEFSSSTPLTRRDGGQYTLIAKNSYGAANHTLQIEVLYPPTFELEREEVNVTQGEEVILECLAEGNPTPELTWNTTAAENPHVSTRGRQSNATVSISRATSANAGVYTCYATNNLGTASKTVTVTVKETDATQWGYIYDLIVLIGAAFMLGLLVLWLRSHMNRQGLYNITSVHSAGRRDQADIPLEPCNVNGSSSCT